MHPKQNAMQNRPSTITYKHISALQLHCKNAKFSDWKYIHINIDYQYQLSLNLAIMPLIMKMVQVTINEGSNKKKRKKNFIHWNLLLLGQLYLAKCPIYPQVLQTYVTKKTLWNKTHLITRILWSGKKLWIGKKSY